MPEENDHLDHEIDNPRWGIVFALLLLLIYYFSDSVQYFLLSSAFKLTGIVPTEGFQRLLKLILPTIIDLAPLALIYLSITRFYKLPFWSRMGWSWPERLRINWIDCLWNPA